MEEIPHFDLVEKAYGRREAKRLLKEFQVTDEKCPGCETGLVMIAQKATVHFNDEGISTFVEMICTTNGCHFNPLRELTRSWEDSLW